MELFDMQKIYKIIRATAWLLVAATVLVLFSGFSTTKYFLFPGIGYPASYYIHTVVIPLVFLPLFYLHTLAGIIILCARHPSLNRNSAKAAFSLLWTGILVAFLFMYSAAGPAGSAGGATSLNSNSNLNSTASSVQLTAAEIAKHNSASSCWLIINGGVYDVTSYLPYHPGGPGLITPYCGNDAANAFATQDRGKPHSPNAESLLGSYYIGPVGGNASVAPAAQAPSASLPPSRRTRDFEDD